MLAFIEITLDVLVLGAVVLVAGFIGFFFKNAKIKSGRHAIERLEKEMLISHAEILRLQKELAAREGQPAQAPIVPIRENTTEPAKENLPDTGIRKKMLTGISKTKP